MNVSDLNEFDIAVIGAGASGTGAALAAAAQGARVALVEKHRIGGAHVWSGDVPLQTLAQTARVLDTCRSAVEFGVHLEKSRLIWSAVRLRIADVRDDIRKVQRENLEAANIQVISGAAQFVDKSTLRVTGKNGETLLRAAKYIIATGSNEAARGIDGLEEVGFITPEKLYSIPALPRTLILIGDGPAACALAQTLARLDCSVTLLAAGSTPLPREDDDVSAFATKILSQADVTIHTGAMVQNVRRDGERKHVFFEVDGKIDSASASEILVMPSGEIDLSALNIRLTGARWSTLGIETDDFLQVAPGVWACGSVVGNSPHVHAATAQGVLAGKNAMASEPEKRDERGLVRRVLTNPEIACIGLAEDEARAGGEDVKIYRRDFSTCDRAIIAGETRGFLKLVTSGDGIVLGAHAGGVLASEMVAAFGLAVREKVPLQAVAATMNDAFVSELLYDRDTDAG